MLSDDGSGSTKKAKLRALRLTKDMDEYLTTRGGIGRGGLTRVLEDALRLHKHLYERLEPHKYRVQRFALDETIEWPKGEPEVMARLALLGLDEVDRRRRRK